MKKMATAGLLAAALSLTALAQQRAAAGDDCCGQRGGSVSFNVGLTLGLHWTPPCGHWVPDCNPCCYPGGPNCYAGGAYGYPPPPYGYPPHGFAPPPPLAPPPKPAGATQGATAAGVQNIGYTYPVYGYGYDYGAVYGYPYYQDPNFGYGR